MSDWTSGYVADIGYTFGYYQELNPIRVKLAFLNSGLVAPEVGVACELGFGQGLSTNMHAAASVCSWHGTDFNPAQASFARELASASGSNAHLYDESFEEFASRDLPEFDYIGLHGIWSWISDQNRQVIVDFIRKRLKVGGVVYVSYNTLPGWGTFAPMRHLMTEHAEVIGADGVGIVSRIDGAIEFTEKLLATNPLFARANPLVSEKIKQIKSQNRHYLAHEYFNRDWHPMHFGAMAKWMESAKLTFACSANYLENIDAINLTSEQQDFLTEIHDPMFKQTVRDFMVNQQFRKDYWVKGARVLSPIEQLQGLLQTRFVMTCYRPAVDLKVKGHQGECTLSEAIYLPILDIMGDCKIRTAAQIHQEILGSTLTISQLMQALMILCGKSVLSVAQDEKVISKVKQHTDRLNLHLMEKAKSNNEIGSLASPVTGGGIPLGRFQQLFLLAIREGKKKPQEWAQFVSQILNTQGQMMIKEGKPFNSRDDQLAELLNFAVEFEKKYLTVLKALQIT